MSEVETPVGVASELSAVVLRCTCGNPDQHKGQVCPQARREDQGVLSYKHRNPVKQAIGRLTRGVTLRNIRGKLNGRQKPE